MRATPQTKPSTPKLSEAARHVVFPPDIVTSGWPKVRAQCAEMGVKFDPWQEGVGTLALGKRSDGKYAATVGGIVLSIPRQVGKTFLVGMIVIALCVLFPGMTVLWTAHRTRTATKTFGSLQGMVKRKKIWPHIAPNGIRTANGEQEIKFANGSIIMFGAREQGFGRGFDEVDIEVFDEGQILTEKALEDMVPAANQSQHKSGALLFFMGTPPRPTDPGEEFTNRRTKALSGKSTNMVYVEFSADQNADPDDREQWAKANPSYPSRTPAESMERMRENLTDDDSYLREALGVWDAVGTDQVIPADKWAAVADASSLPSSRFVLALDVDPAQTRGAVAFAGLRDDGLVHVELDEQKMGTDWIPRYIADRYHRNDIAAVVIDAKSPAAPLAEELRKLKVHRVILTNADEMATACGNFFRWATEDGLRHTNQPQLTTSLAVARKRDLLGGRWAWNRKTSDADITPIVAATLAAWGVKTNKVRGGKPDSEKRGRRVVTW